MSKVPNLNYEKIIHAFERDGWRIIRQRGSHIRLRKLIDGKKHIVIVPAHKPVKRCTLARILKQAHIDLDKFLELL